MPLRPKKCSETEIVAVFKQRSPDVARKSPEIKDILEQVI